jgi:DNA ligase-1
MLKLNRLIADLEGTSSKNDKVAILKKWDDEETKTFLLFALDPYKKFFIRKIPRHKPADKSAIGFDEMIHTLTDLYERKLTGGNAIDRVKVVLESLDVADGDLFQRMLTKDLKCGTNVGTVNKAFPKLVPEFDVQLAAQWDGDKVTWPRQAEPKIDGMRCMAFIEGPEPEDVVFMSRGGKPINTLFNIAEQLVKVFKVGTVLDGEAKALNVTFEGSMSATKRKTAKENAEIGFTIFDCLTDEEFSQQLCKVHYTARRARFVPQMDENPQPGLSYLVPEVVNDIDETLEVYGRVRLEGHEGLILKEADGFYDFKRSRTWMKMKPEETADVEIVGYTEATKGKRIGRLKSFKVMIDGEECQVGGGFSDDQISEFWENRDKMIGDLIEVQYMEKTAKGKTRHCNFVRLRTYKGEKC